jgi:hypothetical protein
MMNLEDPQQKLGVYDYFGPLVALVWFFGLVWLLGGTLIIWLLVRPEEPVHSPPFIDGVGWRRIGGCCHKSRPAQTD